MFVAPKVMTNDSVTIEISEEGGKNKTSVVFCVVDDDGHMYKRAEHWFNDSKSEKKKESEHKDLVS